MSRITRVRIASGAISSGGTASKQSRIIAGRILSVHVDYPASGVTVDLDTDELVSQKVLNLSSASTDITLYPRVALEDNTGTALDLSDTEGGNTAVFGYFVVYGTITLNLASGTQGQEVTVDIIMEEF